MGLPLFSPWAWIRQAHLDEPRQISFLSSSEGLNKMFLETFKLKKVKLEIYKTLSFYFLFSFLIKKKEKNEEEGKTEKLKRGVWTKN